MNEEKEIIDKNLNLRIEIKKLQKNEGGNELDEVQSKIK